MQERPVSDEKRKGERKIRGPMIKLHHVTAERIYPVWLDAFGIVRVSETRKGDVYVFFQGALGEGILVHETTEEVLSLIEEAMGERPKIPPTPEQLEQYVQAARSLAEFAKRIFAETPPSTAGGMPS